MTEKLTVLPGKPEPLGVTVEASGLNVAVVAPDAEAIEVVLFDEDGETRIGSAILPARRGAIHCGLVKGYGAGARYGLRAYGPYQPERGLRFNPAKLLVDPYARALDRPFQHDPRLSGSTDEGAPDPVDTADLVPKAIATAPSRASTRPFQVSRLDRPPLVYELNVRGFTRTHPQVPEDIRGTIAALGHPAVTEHLSSLGVTTVELMPIMAWIDERHLPALGLANAWGYNTLAFMAPDPRIAPGGIDEVRKAVATLHAAGLEVILDIVLNHTGESDELGATVSFRGLDNAGYYRLRPDDPALYVNDTGCGNTVALDRPHALRLAMDTLRYWATAAGVDGFRFDLATTLGRRADGYDPEAPLFQAIEQDPVLRGLKMIAEPWDVGPDGHRLGGMPARWSEWNDRYRDAVRRFWRGDGGTIGELATRLTGSADFFAAAHRLPSASVNFIASHDGFPLADTVAYAEKHNEANGEDNRDGHDANFSWNNGVEGPSDDPAIGAARDRDVANLLTTLFVSRGLPMLAMGDELGRTQAGNNNAYAQDNEMTWVDWASANQERIALVRRLADIRRRHPALRLDSYLTGAAVDGRGLPDIEWLTADGGAMTPGDWTDPERRTLTLVLYAGGAPTTGDRVAVVFNAGADELTATLPPPRDACLWRVVVDTGAEDRTADRDLDGCEIAVAGRSALISVETVDRSGGRGLAAATRAAETRVVDRLAEAAGIAPEWWDVDGTRHLVSPDTKRALLDAMGLPATSAEAARASLVSLSNETVRRALPPFVSATPGASVEVAVPRLLSMRPPRALHLRLADGKERVIPVPSDAAQDEVTAPDGTAVRRLRLTLPPLPIGDHRLRLDDHEGPDGVARIVVAPKACYRPAALASGRRFGIQANLYSLKRAGDGGIGDLTTLAELGEHAAPAGAATIGINPLHALFGGDRNRASPYHPSDRRFLDPIYLDVARIEGTPDLNAAALAEAQTIDYPEVWRIKRKALEAGFEAFRQRPVDDAERQDFEAYLTSRGRSLIEFATFQLISEDRPKVPWMRWPSPLRRPDTTAVAEMQSRRPGEILFHCWLQWHCERQLAETADRVHEAGVGIGLYRDLAVGCAPDGAEAWASQDVLAEGVSVGAPPDPLAADGQVWDTRPPIPHQMASLGYRPFSTLLSTNMRYAGLLRLDHVMSITRLFWIPAGASGRDGAYVNHHIGPHLAALSLASHRYQCGVVGEDLGTVPEGFSDRLAEADILSTSVLLLERDKDQFTAPSAYPARAATCAATHDLPPLAGWWLGRDLEINEAIGRTYGAPEAERSTRRSDRSALLSALATAGATMSGLPSADDDAPSEAALIALIDAIHAFLAKTPSDLVMLQAADLLAEKAPVNVPGTDREWPNWRLRLPEELTADRLAARIGPELATRGAAEPAVAPAPSAGAETESSEDPSSDPPDDQPSFL
ncbi:glycogen debranching protein GlgX [Amorphus sp. 3PC139-8]|uniref:glycogen debranching protein GlgX n=1 Tax=Amorphus sp. 3PC139-8 TaxID=2735676 RepID=UPI00345DF83D